METIQCDLDVSVYVRRPEGGSESQGPGGEGRSATTNNRAEVVTRRDGTHWRLNTLTSRIINYYQKKFYLRKLCT